jgi:hypothetical protein
MVWVLLVADSRAHCRPDECTERTEHRAGQSTQHRTSQRLLIFRLPAFGGTERGALPAIPGAHGAGGPAMTLFTVTRYAGRVQIVRVICSTPRLWTGMFNLPRASCSADVVVRKADLSPADVAMSRRAVINGVEVVAHDFTVSWARDAWG